MELYIAKLSRLFFVSLKEAAVEFVKLFTASERKSGVYVFESELHVCIVRSDVRFVCLASYVCMY